MQTRLPLAALVFLAAASALPDGPADNVPDKVRRIPPPGVPIAAADRAELTEGVARLGRELDALRGELKARPALRELLPDVEIYRKAVHYALAYDEFYKTNEVQTARAFLKQGAERAAALREGRAPWLASTGLVARGYVSRIDGSVQPYGLVIPPTWQPNAAGPFRLDFWLHGRGEKLTELDFIDGRQRSSGEFVPPNAFVLHLYGRYCNGNRFAGETDLFEALEHARKFYPLDENRLVVRGFSLGGAACWHFATHHAWRWAAAAPGAGFSETADFLKVFQREKLEPAAWEQKLWHMYDATDHAVNLFNCPTIAYSGEIDSQKQAADLMVKACAEENLDLVHVIGPKTAHSYHPDAKREINRRLDAIVARGRDPFPRTVRFTTWTLRYNRMHWVTVDALEQHWERARVDAGIDEAENTIRVTTKNVAALTLDVPPGWFPLDPARAPKVLLDGAKVAAPRALSDRSWTARFVRHGSKWTPAPTVTNRFELGKRHGLQGPIDDAFMDSFLLVRPTGNPLNEKVGAWAAAEFARATNQWRAQFRGECRVKDDTAVTEADFAAHHLVLWGDPSSNQLISKIANALPVRWNAENVIVGKQSFPSAHHVPVLIYPNPLNPDKYVVLNSGFTFREYDYLNNARQTSKLPDYAVIDVDQPVTSRAPGGLATAGFFGEKWELKSPPP